MKKYKYNHDCPFEAFVTNLGKYNEGELIGERVKFPTTKEKIQEVFKKISIGSADAFGQTYEERFISDYNIYLNGISSSMLGEFVDISNLNYLANKIEEMSFENFKKFSSIINALKPNDIFDLIEILEKYIVF